MECAGNADWSIGLHASLPFSNESSPMDTATPHTNSTDFSEIDAGALFDAPTVCPGLLHVEQGTYHSAPMTVPTSTLTKLPPLAPAMPPALASITMSLRQPIPRVAPLLKCPHGDCAASFVRDKELQRHLRAKHKIHTCGSCGEEFRHRKTLYEHRQRDHLGVIHYCKFHCGFGTAKKSNVQRHERKMHS
jgi:hypothetical protein